LDSHPDIELEKHLGINRKVDRDPSSSHIITIIPVLIATTLIARITLQVGVGSTLDRPRAVATAAKKYRQEEDGDYRPEWDIRTGESFFGIHT